MRWERIQWAAAPLVLLVASIASAGGLLVQELANPRNGVAQAGQAAYAYDAATSFYNPAGMARLEKTEWLVGAQGTVTDIHYDLNSNTTFDGGDGSQQGGFIPGAAFYYAHRLNDRWSVGTSLAGFAGGAMDPSNDWAGRYYVTKLNLAILGLNPVVSYRVNDWLSVGVGGTLAYGSLDFDLKLPRIGNLIDRDAVRGGIEDRIAQSRIPDVLEAISNLPPAIQDRIRERVDEALAPAREKIDGVSEFFERGPDGTVKMEDLDDFAGGWNVGILIEPTDRTRFGISYRSKIEFDLTGDFDIKDTPPIFQALGLDDGDVRGEVIIPQHVRASVYHQLTDTLAVMGDVGWEDWSQMDFLPISGPAGRTVQAPVNWHDTWHFGLGAEWRVAPGWLLQTGMAFDTSPVRDRQHNQAYMPSGRQWRFSGGVIYDWNERVKIGVNYTLVDFGRSQSDLTNAFGRFQGDYNTFQAHVVAVSASF